MSSFTTTFRVVVDGSECDLTPGQLAERAKALYAVAVRDDSAALQSIVKLGALLLQVRPSFRHGSWQQWLKATGLALNTARRAARLAAAYAGVQGQLDERRLVETIEQYNAACTDEKDRLNPASRSVRAAERAIATPADRAEEIKTTARGCFEEPHEWDDDADFDPDDSPEAVAAALAGEAGCPHDLDVSPSGKMASCRTCNAFFRNRDGMWELVSGEGGGGATGAEETEGLTNTGGGHVVHAPRPSPPHKETASTTAAPPVPSRHPSPETRHPRARVPDAAGQTMLSDLFAELDERIERVRDLAIRGVLSTDVIRSVLDMLERVATFEVAAVRDAEVGREVACA